MVWGRYLIVGSQTCRKEVETRLQPGECVPVHLDHDTVGFVKTQRILLSGLFVRNPESCRRIADKQVQDYRIADYQVCRIGPSGLPAFGL